MFMDKFKFHNNILGEKMKNISNVTKILFIIFVSTFSYSISYGYTSNVHQYIIEQSYELLKYETGIGYIEYDEGIYCYDEDWDPAIIKGVIEEDVYDWIYHYHLVDPQINETFTEVAKNLLRQSIVVWIAGYEIPAMFPSCTHFWDADIGISNQSYLHGEMIELPWSISIDNAFIKSSRFFNG